ncbi:chemotaxis protein CheA [Desulfobacter latus]|uniref:histidine kinase n=1 Tax=Desulfobacter latus TaxID=2292 RepID=A0A850T9F4_9BACT|nr:chemotaxis protein CheW [Desulfobacter latus]NWH05148.1 chemotaxis protein CheW [Desulfobacter latus]
MTEWKDLNIDEEIIEKFIEESLSGLDVLTPQLFNISEKGDEVIDAVFRWVHTVKGTSGFFNLTGLQQFSHRFETFLQQIKSGDIALEHTVNNIVTEGVDLIYDLLVGLKAKSVDIPDICDEFLNALDKQQAEHALNAIDQLISITDQLVSNKSFFSDQGIPMGIPQAVSILEKVITVSNLPASKKAEVPEGEKQESAQEASKPDPLPEEPVSLSPEPICPPPAEPESALKSVDLKEDTLRIGAGYLDDFTRKTEALVMDRNYLENLEREIKPHLPDRISRELGGGLVDLENNIAGLQKALFSIRSSRLNELFERLPRMIRQLEKDLDKPVELKIAGQDIEVDRSIISILADPLVHLIRNAVDHGLENKAERTHLGKPAIGLIQVVAAKTEEWLELRIQDDGKGIDPEKILAKAISKGIADKTKTYTNEEIYRFILAPGFSTAEKVTNVSGRGVGMDVVMSALKKQGGNIAIESTLGKGSVFKLLIPIKQGSLTKEVLLVEIDGQQYAVNHQCLKEIIRAEEIVYREHQSSAMLNHRNELIRIADMGRILHCNGTSAGKDRNQGRYLILEDENKNVIAARVDKTLGRLQVVIKPFDHELLKSNPLFEGTVVIGSGQPLLVISLVDAEVFSGNEATPLGT